MKSLENMARDEIIKYMTPYPKINFPGLSLEKAKERVLSIRGIGWEAPINNAYQAMKNEH